MAEPRELRWHGEPDVQETFPEDLMVRGEVEANDPWPAIGEAVRVPGREGTWRIDRIHASGKRGQPTYVLELGVIRTATTHSWPWRRVKRETP